MRSPVVIPYRRYWPAMRSPAALLVAASVAACAASPAASPVLPSPDALPSPLATPQWTPDPSWPTPPPPPSPLPVNPALPPKTVSALEPGDLEALTACGATDPDFGGLASVAGFAYLNDLRDAPKYVRVGDRAPQLLQEVPGWIVQFRGERPQVALGESWVDPTCIYANGEPVFYATGPIRDLKTGEIIRGYWDGSPAPVNSLPPLAGT